MKRSGFTLIEALIVIGILTLMTSLLIIYSRAGEFQIILLKEKAGIISSLLRARNLSYGTLISDPAEGTVCGYGFHLEGNNYFSYRYLVPFSIDPDKRCQRGDKQYNSAEDKILEPSPISLHPSAKFSKLEVKDILFEVATSQIYFDGLLAAAPEEKTIEISDLNNTTKVTIAINNIGQISEK